MKTFTDYNIDPLALSFGQLKQMLPSTAGQKLPAPLVLEQDPPEILFRHEIRTAEGWNSREADSSLLLSDFPDVTSAHGVSRTNSVLYPLS